MPTRHRRIHSAAAVAAVGSLWLAACGGDESGVAGVPATDGVSDPLPTAQGDATDPADDVPARVEIAIADFAFVGDEQVPVGTTVLVANTDAASHTWTALDGTFDSGTLGQGDEFEFTFTEPGTYEYRCNFHPSMTGTITVTG